MVNAEEEHLRDLQEERLLKVIEGIILSYDSQISLYILHDMYKRVECVIENSGRT